MAAHVGGLVVGFACGVMLGHPLRPEAVGGRRLRNVILGMGGILFVVLGCVLARERVAHSDDPMSEMSRMSAEEERILTLYNNTLQLVEAGRLDDDGLVVVVERDVLPPWREIRQRFDQVKGRLVAKPQAVRQYGEYLRVREEAWELWCRAVRENSPDLAARSREKSQEGDKLLKSLNELNKGP
jgi:hypothetical protein